MRQFERLYAKYKAVNRDAFIKVKTKLVSYALLAKGPWVGMCAMVNHQIVTRTIEEVLSEKLAVSAHNLDYSFCF